MTDLDTEEPFSSLSDSSFVILGQGSLPLLPNDDTCKEPILNSIKNSKESFSCFESIKPNIRNSQGLSGSIFNEDCIQKKLNELVKENYQLKETLSQNNLAIKSQLDTFFMWQQEVLKTNETHKQKFLETKELILNLRAENTSLKKQLDDSLVCSSSGSDVGVYAEVNKKHDEVDKLKDKLKEYEKINNDLTCKNENLNMELLKLNEELKCTKSQLLKLNNEFEDLGMYLKQRNGDCDKDCLESVSHRSPNSEARLQISNLLQQLDEEKSKVLKLKEELKIKKNNELETGSKLSATEQLNQYIENLNDMDVSIDMQNQRFNSLQSWVCLAEEGLKENKISAGVECNLMCEINVLKTHLNQEENVSRKKQETLKELKRKFTLLLDDYKALQHKLNAMNNKDVNVEKYKEEISSLSATLKSKDNELKSKEEECNNLKEEIDKLNLLVEVVDVLKIQIEVYQSDFSDEREAREKVVSEKEKMAEQVRLLQRKINDLEEKKKGLSEISPQESSRGSTNYLCPRCVQSFTESEHINECSGGSFFL